VELEGNVVCEYWLNQFVHNGKSAYTVIMIRFHTGGRLCDSQRECTLLKRDSLPLG
jgi:hypothetical protein